MILSCYKIYTRQYDLFVDRVMGSDMLTVYKKTLLYSSLLQRQRRQQEHVLTNTNTTWSTTRADGEAETTRPKKKRHRYDFLKPHFSAVSLVLRKYIDH
jgi:hypothetical protein